MSTLSLSSTPGIANIRFRRKGDGRIEILAYPGEDAREANDHASKSPRPDSNGESNNGTRLHIDSLQVESHRAQAVAASNVASDLCTTAGSDNQAVKLSLIRSGSPSNRCPSVSLNLSS